MTVMLAFRYDIVGSNICSVSGISITNLILDLGNSKASELCQLLFLQMSDV